MHQKLEKSLEILWTISRFTSYFYQAVQFVENKNIPTITLTSLSSRLVLFYNTDFFNKLKTEQLIGLLVHEMLHIILNHDHRSRSSRDAHLQNLAQDMVVNSYIIKNRDLFFSKKSSGGKDRIKLKLPEGLPSIPEKFHKDTGNEDPSWEEIYSWLMAQSEDNYYSFDGTLSLFEEKKVFAEDINSSEKNFDLGKMPGTAVNKTFDKSEMDMKGVQFTDSDGSSMPTGIHMYYNDVTKHQMESVKRRVVKLAEKDHSVQGDRIFQDITRIIMDTEYVDTSSWEKLLKSIIDFSSQSNEWTYTFSRFNKRYFQSGIYAPGRVFKEKQAITVAIDVSASMTMKPGEIEAAFGVLEDLLNKYKIYLLCIDETVFVPEKKEENFVPSQNSNKPYIYKKGDWKFIKTGNSGTTFFAPLFNNYMKKHRETLVVITDGYIYDLNQLEKYHPTLWVISSNRKEPFTAPFGQVVEIAKD